MKNALYVMIVCAAILAGIAPAAQATTWTVGTVSDLRSRLENDAAPGDTIRVLPGTYSTRLYAGNVHGAPGQLINVIAADPTNPPVFNSGGYAAWTIYNSSYVLVDGMITENAGADRGYSGLSAPEPASWRAARKAPIIAGPVPPPRKNAPWKIPSPAPISPGSPSESAFAAAFTAAGLTNAKPTPMPIIPIETTTGDAPAP